MTSEQNQTNQARELSDSDLEAVAGGFGPMGVFVMRAQINQAIKNDPQLKAIEGAVKDYLDATHPK